MTHADIRDYLQKKGGASLGEIASHFKADPANVESMLDRWILKGRVVAKQHDAFGSVCCGKCSGSGHVRYEWTG